MMPISGHRSRASLADAVRGLFDNWRRQRHVALELARCGDSELARIARDMQLRTRQLHEIALRPPDSADLLYERMAALGLSPGSVGRATLRDLERVCSLCTTKKRCARELAKDPANEVWREHCPNAGTLAALEDERPVNH